MLCISWAQREMRGIVRKGEQFVQQCRKCSTRICTCHQAKVEERDLMGPNKKDGCRNSCTQGCSGCDFCAFKYSLPQDMACLYGRKFPPPVIPWAGCRRTGWKCNLMPPLKMHQLRISHFTPLYRALEHGTIRAEGAAGLGIHTCSLVMFVRSFFLYFYLQRFRLQP